jgi:Protein of unknown function (DUF3237)
MTWLDSQAKQGTCARAAFIAPTFQVLCDGARRRRPRSGMIPPGRLPDREELMQTASPTPFEGASRPDDPRLEFVFEIALTFGEIEMLPALTSGFVRGAVYIADGTITGPRLQGRVIGGSGGDWAEFRPDGTVATDARYMLEADDGTHILMRNRGFLWGRTPDVMDRIRDWMFGDGPPVDASEFYLRAAPSFEVGPGPHDWLTRHIIVGVGTRQRLGNTIRYHALL